MEATRILLVRHGESEGNVLNVFTGHRAYPLTPMGHRQAAITAQYIKEHYTVDAVYSSDLPRAFQTAEHIALQYDLPIVTDPALRELYGGQWENKCFSELPEQYPGDFSVWTNDTIHACCTGGESILELTDRVVTGIKKIAGKHPGQTLVMVTHATPIRTALWKISQSPDAAFQTTNFGCNCAVSELVFENGMLSVVSANYTDHLQGCKTQLPSNI